MASNSQSRHKNHEKIILKRIEEHVPEQGKRKKRCFHGHAFKASIRKQCSQTGGSDDAQELGRPENFPKDQSSTRKGDFPKQVREKDNLMGKCSERMGGDGFDPGKATNHPMEHGIHSPAAGGKSPASDETHIMSSKRKRVEKLEQDLQNRDLGSSNEILNCDFHETSIPVNRDSLLKVSFDSQKAAQRLNNVKCYVRRAKKVSSSSRTLMNKPRFEGLNGTSPQIQTSICKSFGIEAIHEPNHENQSIQPPKKHKPSLPMKLPVSQIPLDLPPGQGPANVPQDISHDGLILEREVPSIISESPSRNNVHNVKEQNSDYIFHREELNGMKWNIQSGAPDVGESVVMEKASAARTAEVDRVKGSSIDVPDLNMVSTSPSHDFQRQTFDGVHSSLQAEEVPRERCEAVPRSEGAGIGSVEIVTPNEDEPVSRDKARSTMIGEAISIEGVSNVSSDEETRSPNHFPSSVQTEKIPTGGHETAPNKAAVGGIPSIERGNLDINELNTENMGEDVNASNVVLTNENGGSNGYKIRHLPAVSESADDVLSQRAASLSNNLSLPDPVLQNDWSRAHINAPQEHNQCSLEVVPSQRPSDSAPFTLSACPPVTQNLPLYAADPLKADFERLQKEREQHHQCYEATKLRLKSDQENETLELITQLKSKYEAKFLEAEAKYLNEKQETDKKLVILARNRALALASRSTGLGPRRIVEALLMQAAPSSSITLQLSRLHPLRHEPQSSTAFNSSRDGQFSGFQQPTAPRHPQNVRHSGALQSPFDLSSSGQFSGFLQPTAPSPHPPNARHSGATQPSRTFASPSAAQIPSLQRATAPPHSGPPQSLLASSSQFSGFLQPTAAPHPQTVRQPVAPQSSYTFASSSASQVPGLQQPTDPPLSLAMQSLVRTSECPSHLHPARQVQVQNVRQSGPPHVCRRTRLTTPHGRSS